jgi:hypothetical protein
MIDEVAKVFIRKTNNAIQLVESKLFDIDNLTKKIKDYVIHELTN